MYQLVLAVPTASLAAPALGFRFPRLTEITQGAVGKSCLTIRYVQGTFVTEYDPTIGMETLFSFLTGAVENSYRRIATVDEQPVVLDILDTAGQEEYASTGFSFHERNSDRRRHERYIPARWTRLLACLQCDILELA